MERRNEGVRAEEEEKEREGELEGEAGRKKEEGRVIGNTGSGGGGRACSGGGSEFWVGGRRREPEGSGRASGARTEQRPTTRNVDTSDSAGRNS